MKVEVMTNINDMRSVSGIRGTAPLLPPLRVILPRPKCSLCSSAND